MKWVCLLLLAANLAYFGWTLDQRTRENLQSRAERLQVSKDVPRLKLISELEQPPVRRMDVSEERAQERVGGTASGLVATLPEISTTLPESLIVPMRLTKDACFSFGPFAEAGRARQLESWLREQGTTVRLHRENGNEKQQLFWIYLAPDAGAEEVMHELRASGIRDISLIDSGDMQNAVSLGLFSNQASVNRRLRELEGTGYQPVVVPYNDSRPVYRVEARIMLGETIQALTQAFPAGLSYVPVQCDKIALDASKP